MTLAELGLTKDEVLKLLTDRLIGEFSDDCMFDRVQHALAQKVEAAVRAAVEKVTQTNVAGAVEDVIARPWPQTNSYGEARGEPLTFREMVLARIDKYLNELTDEHDRTGYNTNGPKRTRLEWIVNRAVAESVASQITAGAKEAAEKARAEVLGKMDAAVIAAVRNVLGIK